MLQTNAKLRKVSGWVVDGMVGAMENSGKKAKINAKQVKCTVLSLSIDAKSISVNAQQTNS